MPWLAITPPVVHYVSAFSICSVMNVLNVGVTLRDAHKGFVNVISLYKVLFTWTVGAFATQAHFERGVFEGQLSQRSQQWKYPFPS